jgi:hypothetical protein
MKPYRNLKSLNLGSLLFIARFLAYIGWFILALGGLSAVTSFIGLFSKLGFFQYNAMIGAFAFFPIGIMILVFSGIMAAIVAFEDNYRIRTVHLTSK